MVENWFQPECVDVSLQRSPLVGTLQELPGSAGEDLGDVVDILGLDRHLEFLLGDGLEIIEEFRPGIAPEDLLPPGLPPELSQVRFELSGKDLHRRGLPNPVLAEDPGDFPFNRNGKTVECESVHSIAVRGVLELLGEAHDIYRLEGALFHADPAPHAQLFGDYRLALLRKDYRFVSGADPGTVGDALGPAFAGMASVTMNYCNAHTGSD